MSGMIDWGNVDSSDFISDDHKVTGFFWSDENEIIDEEIGEVCLSNFQDMPFEIEINGITYKKEK